MGVIRASFQSVGTSPMSSEVWKIVMSMGAISSAARESTLLGIISGPEALCGFKVLKSFVMSEVVTVISRMDGILLGSSTGMFVTSSLV